MHVRKFRFHLRILAVILMAAGAAAQWEKLSVPTTAGLRGLSVVDDNVVWASGTNGRVIRTVDGGKHWSVIIVPGAAKLDFRGIRAFDQKTAVIISSGPAENGQARIYRTTDGGETWQQVFEEKRKGIFFDAVAFWDRRHGIVLSDPVDGRFALFTSEDAGLTWKQIPAESLPAALPNEGAFAASNSCLTVQGTGNVWFATGGGSVARVFHSTDRGKTWSVTETLIHPANGSSGIFSLYFEDAKNGVALVGDYTRPNASIGPNILGTSDGGLTWKSYDTGDQPGVYLSSMASFWSPGKDSEIAVGTAGAFIAEGSSQWKKELGENLNSVAATDYKSTGQRPIIWAIGPRGVVMRNRVLYEKGRRR